MRNNYLPYNPVFESLSDQVKRHKYSKIYESGIDAEKVEDYAKRIFSVLSSNFLHFFLSIPDDMKEKVFPDFIKAVSTPFPTGTKLDAVIKACQELWAKAKNEALASKNKELYAPFVEKVSKGIESVGKAYEALQKEAGELMTDAAITASVLQQINDFNAMFIKDWKEKTSKS